MKLHLGCGDKKLDGFINVDIRETVGCDIIDDISRLSTFNNNSAKMIYCCHVLEHFGRNDFKKVLKRWNEILVPGGILRLSVPDLEQVFKQYVNNKISLKNLIGFLYGGQNYPENFHYMGYDFELLKEVLLECGFDNVKKWNWKEVEHGNVDDYSQAYLPHLDKENGVLMSLNIECIKK